MNELVEVRLNNWARIIKARQDSGQTVKVWCAENDVSINAYYYWLRKVRKKAVDLAEYPEPGSPQFAKVSDHTLGYDPGTALLIRRGDTVIEVSNDISENLLSFLKEMIMTC